MGKYFIKFLIQARGIFSGKLKIKNSINFVSGKIKFDELQDKFREEALRVFRDLEFEGDPILA